MDEIKNKLFELLTELDEALSRGEFDTATLTSVRNKLKLYIKRLFDNNPDYKELVDEVDISVIDYNSFLSSMNQLRSVISAMMDDIDLSVRNLDFVTEDEKQKILAKAREEAEKEREKLQAESNAIQQIKEDLQKRTESILLEEEKLNSFKAKLEFADKGVDFQTDAKTNKQIAIIWAVALFLLLVALVWILCITLKNSDVFSNIAKSIQKDFASDKVKYDLTIINNTIYISYGKYIFSKLLLYSLLIYGIRFCAKNYNAQMHNFIINSHKSNSLKSTLSLLDTAKSEDGNDKLLVQATQAIFSHQNTGYGGAENDIGSPNLVTNVIENVSKKI
ncbi:hypothetical protein [Flavobacterium sp. WV_118_3]|uniref:hypothetical protein n=1 Tax=Flavobacterium sp. WV_118_3 TaxID=3151764 RepID=UPI00321A3D80